MKRGGEKPLPHRGAEQPARMPDERGSERRTQARGRSLIRVVAELRAKRKPAPRADRRPRGEMPAEDRANLVRRALALVRFLAGVPAKTNERAWQPRDLRAGEKAAHPEIVIEREMVTLVEIADALLECAAKKNFRLHPLPLAPPHAVNVEDVVEI